ncbi:hypothetical protein Cni_G11578 [Canna indica]|uniref:Protein AAR2 homolog n=1 Tax=Canna indica TaxID=4628 RepID=A0AAQ3K6V9_9LILI|nr:hypothetical protein Cni_G11578 [Canna indica]
MDQEAALDLVKKGATLLLLDVPQFTLFGIDTQMFSVGPLFKGMKMIPPGTHFVYYSPSNKEGNEFSPTVGFFLITHPAEVVVRKWHHKEERLIKLSEEEEGRYSEAVRRLEFDTHLGPYALDRYGEWKQLSNFITQNIIDRLEPIGGDITIAFEPGLIDQVPRTAMEKRLMEQLRCNKFSKFATEASDRRGCYYTSIPHSIKRKGISGEELTAINHDKTELLEVVLMKDYGGEEDSLLGELQFSFIAFMMAQSLEAFLQWKAIVILLISCIEAPLRTRTRLFAKFIRVIYYQLKHGLQRNESNGTSANKGISLFLDEVWFSKDIFLFRLCKDFFPLVLDSPVVDGDLLSWTRKLKSLLETALGWDFADDAMELICDEGDEFSPVIVPFDEAN